VIGSGGVKTGQDVQWLLIHGRNCGIHDVQIINTSKFQKREVLVKSVLWCYTSLGNRKVYK
jgi:hypothetical protein